MRLVTRLVPAFCAGLMMIGCSKSEPAPTTQPAAPAEQPAENKASAKDEAANAKAGEAGEAGAKAGEAGEAGAKAGVAAEAVAEAGDKAAAAVGEAEKKLGQMAGELDGAVKAAEAMVGDDSPALTAEEYEKLLLGLSACQVGEWGIERECEAKKAFDEARKRNTRLKELAGMTSTLGQKHIGHEAPAVRLQSAQMMSSIFGADSKSQEVLLAAAGKEQDPMVLKSMIGAVGSTVSRNPEVKDLLMKTVDHEHEKVRIESISWLTTSFANGTEGTLEKVLDKIEKDPSDKVRQYACERVGGREDERALPLLDKLTSDKNPDDKMAAACMRGLIKMWAGFPKPKEPSEKAYQLTLKRLSAKPRSKERPSWTIMSDFRSIVTESPNSFHTEWEGKAKWVDKKALLKVLADVVADRQANWMARTGAVDTMVKLGADKAALEKLASGYKDIEGKFGEDSHVLKKLNDAVAKM